MTCSTCGRDNPAHLTFCQECGQRLGPRIAPPTPPIGLGAQDPAFQSGGHAPAPAPAPQASGRVPTALGGAAASGDRRCKICETVNGANLRYCTSCGSTLEPVAAAAATVAPSPPAAMSEAPKTVQDHSQKTCVRCRGLVDPGAQFCKFCGNPVGEAAAAPVNGSVVPQPAASPRPAAGIAPVAPTPMAPSVVPNIVPSHKYGPPPQASGAAALAAAPIAPVPVVPAVPSPPAATPGAAPTKQRGRLVVIAKSGADGPNYPFGDSFDVGRSEGNVVVPEDPYLSPRHVRILWTGGKLVLRDLGSTNGVYLRLAASRDTSPRRGEGSEIAIPLHDQDMILVGQQVLRFDVLREGEGGLGPASEHGTLLFGSPAAPRYARLCQRTVEGIARDVYYLRKTETVLGRESGDVVFTEDPFLSRRHAAIRVLSREGASARFALVDLGSSNGTFIKLKGEVELAPGDHFRVGQQLFRVDFDGVQN